jgi:hypothetical protein
MNELLPKPKIEWKVTIGDIVRTIVIVLGFVWAASALATKYAATSEEERIAAQRLIARVEKLETDSVMQGGRLVAIETSLQWIREAVQRIERAVAK